MITEMKTTTKFIVMTFFICANAVAGDVKMFSDRPPSAAEMGSILFSKKASAPTIKTRSISFGKSKPVAAEQPQEEALAEEASNTVGLPIKFGYNSTEISAESKPFLDEVGNMLSLEEFSQEKLVIEGHTDAAGSEKYNRYLSKKRAAAVKTYLAKNFKIAEDRLFVSGKGESQPLKGKDPYDGVNRRVQFYSAP
jgi:outer membrane protein OmpA-like peptidoglycan-associated protein